MRDAFVRPHVGDALAVVFVYCALRARTPLPVWQALASSYAIACALEARQYFRLLEFLGLPDNTTARIILGYGFELTDFSPAQLARRACLP